MGKGRNGTADVYTSVRLEACVSRSTNDLFKYTKIHQLFMLFLDKTFMYVITQITTTKPAHQYVISPCDKSNNYLKHDTSRPIHTDRSPGINMYHDFEMVEFMTWVLQRTNTQLHFVASSREILPAIEPTPKFLVYVYICQASCLKNFALR